jgi:hypothetical protein
MRHLKTARLLLCCIALNDGLAAAVQAQAAPLYWQCSDQCEQNAEMENKPVHKEKNGNLSVWWSVNFALGGSAVHSAEVMTELDCLAGLGRDRAIVYFEQPRLAGGVKGFSIDNGWYTLNTQRFNDFLLKVCSAHTASAD